MQSREKLIIVYLAQGPGHVMYPGVHNVRYVASDAAGNRAECHFSIHVRGKFMPFVPRGAPPSRASRRRERRRDATDAANSLQRDIPRRVAFFSHKYIM